MGVVRRFAYDGCKCVKGPVDEGSEFLGRHGGKICCRNTKARTNTLVFVEGSNRNR